jgi:hypothetical protein
VEGRGRQVHAKLLDRLGSKNFNNSGGNTGGNAA